MTTRALRGRRVAMRLAACAVIGAVATVGVAWAIAFFQVLAPGGNGRAQAPTGKWRLVPLSEFRGPPERVYVMTSSGLTATRESASDPGRAHGELSWLVWDTGWPLRALSCAEYDRLGDNGVTQTGIRLSRSPYTKRRGKPVVLMDQLPKTVNPAGFALDTAFYAAITFTLWSAPPVIRHRLRRARGRCRACGYDLNGAPSPTCPECGA